MNALETISKATKPTRKFKDQSFYDAVGLSNYYLLPFRFHRLSDGREVLVNDLGNLLVVEAGTVERIVSRQVSKEAYPDLYQDLLANFFITDQPIPELIDVMAARYRTRKSFLDYFTALHIFVISLRCEHTCHYCQVSRVSHDRHAFDMARQHIDRGIDMMMQSPNPRLTMEFQGGEALLAFDNIVYAIKSAATLAERYGKQMTYVICSNLAPLTNEILSFCRDYKVLISTSLDGPAFLHNKNRPRPQRNSHELAVLGIEKCRQVLGEERVSALLTTTRLSLDYPNEIVDEYFRLGFRSIFLRPISPYGFATKSEKKNHYEMSRFLEFYRAALDRIIYYNLQGTYYREEYATIILKKMMTPFAVGYVDLQSPAGMINNVIVFNYDGHVYATDEARMLAEMKDYSFQLGHLDRSTYEDIFYGARAQELSEVWTNESLPGCSECAFQTFCGADPVHNYATQGNLVGHRPTSSYCQKNMGIITHLLERMDSDPRVEAIFRSWTDVHR